MHNAKEDAALAATLITQTNAVEKPSSSRPTVNDEAVLRMVIEQHMQQICDWSGESDADEDERARMMRDFLSAMSYEDDAYRVCYELDHNHGWSPDAELVDLVDNVLSSRWSALGDAEKAWVATTHPEIKFAVGERVTWQQRRGRWKDGPEFTGEVVKVDAGRARYHVFCEELGHVRPGSSPAGNLAAIVNAEDAWAAEPAKEVAP